MVNNNGIPIEVKKPFETVQELKNEIPSFEEFMKDYKVDGNLNYDDLSGGDVGTPKASGPCYYDNADCVCYTSSGWVQLYLGCPAEECTASMHNVNINNIKKLKICQKIINTDTKRHNCKWRKRFTQWN